jgi:hypothetical protein
MKFLKEFNIIVVVIITSRDNFETKGALTHPVSACVFWIGLQFLITYLEWAKPSVSYEKLQRNEVNACGNRMRKLSLNYKYNIRGLKHAAREPHAARERVQWGPRAKFFASFFK